tara:strand:- start:913 stop:1116 length:204 start_codon:yes stop_codon:yes gene_type:complete
MERILKTKFIISGKKFILKYERKMPEKEVIKMKSFVTNKGEKLVKTSKFKIKKVNDKDEERIFEIVL